MDNITDCELQARGMFPDKDFDFTGCDALAINPTMREFARLADRYPEAGTRIKYVGTYKDVRKWQKIPFCTLPHGETENGRTVQHQGAEVVGVASVLIKNIIEMQRHLQKESNQQRVMVITRPAVIPLPVL
jgi:hypothetical protein